MNECLENVFHLGKPTTVSTKYLLTLLFWIQLRTRERSFHASAKHRERNREGKEISFQTFLRTSPEAKTTTITTGPSPHPTETG